MPRASLVEVYFNRRMAALVGLGFASGLPNVLTADTLKAWLSAASVRVEDIGLFSLVAFPYVFKFLWAPLLDRYVPPLLGRRRGWLLMTQVGLVIGLIAIALSGPSEAGSAHPLDLTWLAVAAVAVVFLSASQDIVADAYRADVLPSKELGVGAAVFVMGYRIAMIAGGAGALFLASRYGWRISYLLLAGAMASGVLFTLFAPEPRGENQAPVTLADAVVQPVRHFLRRLGYSAILVLAFMFLFRLPDVLGNAMTMPLLIRHLEFSLNEIGAVRQLVGFFVTIVGALVGGGIVSRIGMVRSLWIFGVLQALSNAGFYALALTGHSMPLFVVVVVIESFCGGLVAAGFVAYLMSQCDQKYSAFQYAIFSALMAATGLVFSPLAGYLVAWVGYANYFLITIAAALPGMALLPGIRESRGRRADEPEAEHLCPVCGYDLRGMTGPDCPECGASIGRPVAS